MDSEWGYDSGPDPGRPRPPGWAEKTGNFAAALAGHVLAGCPTADAATVAARLAVCEPCPQRLPGGTCAGCGCNLRVKAGWADQHCPLGKWPGDAPVSSGS